jgi:hypothetical protein
MDLLNLSDVIFGESLHTPDMNSRFAKRAQRGSGRMVGKPYLGIISGLPVIQAQSFDVYPADHIRAG